MSGAVLGETLMMKLPAKVSMNSSASQFDRIKIQSQKLKIDVKNKLFDHLVYAKWC